VHILNCLRRLDREVDGHHVFHAELYPFPVLGFLRKPVVYTVVSGLGRGRIPSPRAFRRLVAVAVPTPGDRDRLTERGFSEARVIVPGVDLSRFEHAPIAVGETFTLLVGSAPWTRGQFRSKGMDAVLEVARRIPSLRLVFLWRGWLLEELHRRIAARGLTDRAEVITERVDVSEVFRRAHAAVVLARSGDLVKAFPHSLLEALACGRPVLVSDCIAMSDYVGGAGCGRVVRGVSPSDLGQEVRALRERYEWYSDNARRVGRRDFSVERVVEAYRPLYEAMRPGTRTVSGSSPSGQGTGRSEAP
jgi:glycosyltransferase involved in cell wall biosynthesis